MIDKLVTQLHTVDIEFLVEKCRTLMASDVHNIKLFTDSFIKKLFKCSHSTLLKIYLLPFNTWLDNTILVKVVTANKENDTVKLLRKFNSRIDDTQSITLYPIPNFSQLIIPLDDCEHSIVATETLQNCSEFTLKGVVDVKELLTSLWELTAHAIQLAAIDYHYNCMYWMIPKQVKSLVEDKLSQGQRELQCRGIFMAVLLPNSFFYNFDQQVINSPFNISNDSLKDLIEVRVCSWYSN